MQDFVEYLAKSLVSEPDSVEVKVDEDPGRHVRLELYVADDDTGRIIGKQGRVANSIRTLLRAMAARDGVRVTLNIQ